MEVTGFLSYFIIMLLIIFLCCRFISPVFCTKPREFFYSERSSNCLSINIAYKNINGIHYVEVVQESELLLEYAADTRATSPTTVCKLIRFFENHSSPFRSLQADR